MRTDPTVRVLTPGEEAGLRSLDLVLSWRYGPDWRPVGNGTYREPGSGNVPPQAEGPQRVQ